MKIEDLYPTDEEIRSANPDECVCGMEDCGDLAKFAVENAAKKIVEWMREESFFEMSGALPSCRILAWDDWKTLEELIK